MILEGESLVLEAMIEPPQAVVDALSRHKLAILDLLRQRQGRWSAERWRQYFDERVMFIGGQPEAEATAFACCVAEWLDQHPAPSPPGRCRWCGNQESAGALVLPFGATPCHAWLHAECWPAWHKGRSAEAIAALEALGLHL